MICATCRKPVPEHLIACEACTIAKSNAAVWEHQKMFVRDVESGKWPMKLGKRAPTDLVLHIVMFDAGGRAFCGEMARTRPNKAPLYYSAEALAGCCAGCVERLEANLAECHAQAAAEVPG
jgi:hypothetical protein